MMENEVSLQVLEELKRMNRFLALIATANKPRGETIRLLSEMGYSGPDIAQLLFMTSNAVRQMLHKERKKEKSKGD